MTRNEADTIIKDIQENTNGFAVTLQDPTTGQEINEDLVLIKDVKAFLYKYVKD